MRLLISFLIFLIPLISFGQNELEKLATLTKRLDSLQKLPNSFSNDTLIINALGKKAAIEASTLDTELGVKTAQKAIDLSEKISWKKGLIESHFAMGEALHVKSVYFTSIIHFLKVIELTDKGEDDIIHAKSLRHISGSYTWMERPLEAKKYGDLFLEKIKNIKRKHLFIYDGICDYGNLYSRFLNQPNKGIKYIKQAMKGYESLKDSFGLAYANGYLGVAYTKLNEPKLALKAFDAGIPYFKKNNVDYLLADAYIYKSEFYMKYGQLDKAAEYAEMAKTISEKMHILFSINYSNRILYNIYKTKGNNKLALEHFEKYANSRDSMSEANIDDRLKVVRYDYETQLQKRQLQQKSNQITSLIAGLIGLLIIAFLVYRFLNIRKNLAENQVKQFQQEKQIIASNALFEGQEAERSRMAKDLHDGLGGMLSGIKLNLSAMKGNVIIAEHDAQMFTKSISQLDSAISEMRRIAHNMMPEALLKFGLNEAVQDFADGINESKIISVKYQHIGLKNRLEKSTEVILYRIIQELCNNTIKHAQAKNIFIQLNQHEQGITLTVEDDGQGFDSKNIGNSRGAGLQNVQSRVDFLKGTLHIDSVLEQGTSAIIEIPY